MGKLYAVQFFPTRNPNIQPITIPRIKKAAAIAILNFILLLYCERGNSPLRRLRIGLRIGCYCWFDRFVLFLVFHRSKDDRDNDPQRCRDSEKPCGNDREPRQNSLSPIIFAGMYRARHRTMMLRTKAATVLLTFPLISRAHANGTNEDSRTRKANCERGQKRS